MEKTLLEDELTEEDLLHIEGGMRSPEAIQKQKEYYEELRKRYEQKKSENPEKVAAPEIELTDEQLEGIKAGRTHI